MATESHIYRMSSAGGVTSDTRYPNMLTNYGDFGAMQRIAYQVADGTSGYITFNNIPQNYQDLRVVFFPRSATTGTSTDIYLRLATTGGVIDTGTNYSFTRLYGNGTSAASDRNSPQSYITIGSLPASGATSGIFGSGTLDILNYANSTTYKTSISRSAADTNGAGYTTLIAGLWRNTAAITSVQIITNTSFVSGSTVSLYGIRAGNS